MSEKKVWSRRILWAAGYAAVFIAAFVYLKSDSSRGTTLNEAYKQEIRNALAEIDFPSSNNLAEISTATADLSDFMNYRAGIQIDQANKNLLNTTEQGFWNDSRIINLHGLAEAMTEVAVERIPTLSNLEIAAITESLRGFDAPGLPVGYVNARNYVHLRGRVMNSMLATSFSNELTNLRDGQIDSKVTQNLIRLALENEIDRKMKLIREAEPAFFANSTDMSPIQALFVAYAVATDDTLVHNQVGLNGRLTAVHQSLVQLHGSFPSPSGHKAFGDNGYLQSTPAALALSGPNVTLLINKINAKGVTQ